MPYLFATEDLDYSDYAGGRVIYSQPGAPAFPVRLASEILQRALRYTGGRRLVLYDPTCGGSYHLAALGLLHGDQLRAILASDADPAVLPLAERNLGLLSPAGLNRRESELTALVEQFGKESHREALQSLARLRRRLAELPPLQTKIFAANVFDSSTLQSGTAGETIDLVISDVPYGQLTGWIGASTAQPGGAVWQMLETLRQVIPPACVVAIAADKSQKIAHAAYRRLEHFRVGKRQVALLQVTA